MDNEIKVDLEELSKSLSKDKITTIKPKYSPPLVLRNVTEGIHPHFDCWNGNKYYRNVVFK